MKTNLNVNGTIKVVEQNGKAVNVRQAKSKKDNSPITFATVRGMFFGAGRDENGNNVTGFIDVECAGTSALRMVNVKKGDLVQVNGRLDSNSFTTKDGQNRTVIRIRADEAYVIADVSAKPQKPEAQQSQPQAQNQNYGSQPQAQNQNYGPQNYGSQSQSYGPQGYGPQGYGPQTQQPQPQAQRQAQNQSYGSQGYGPQGYGPQTQPAQPQAQNYQFQSYGADDVFSQDMPDDIQF